MIHPLLRPFSASLFAWWLIFVLSPTQTGGPPAKNVLRPADDSIARQLQEQEGTVLYFPDYVDGEGWSVQLVLSNVDPDLAAEVRIEVFDPDGQPVLDLFDSELTLETPALGSQVLRSAGSGAIRRGWIQVRGQTASISGLLTYRHAQSGIEVGVKPVELGNQFALFLEETDTIGSGLALFNPDSSSAIQFRIRDQDGNDPLGGGSVSWDDFHQAARTLPEWFAGQGVDTEFLTDFRGLLFLDTEDGSAFAPLGLRFGKRTSSLSAVPAIPNRPRESLPTTLYFPDYVDGEGWSVQLVLSNIDTSAAAQVAVQVYDPAGQPILDLFDSESSFEIAPQSSWVLSSEGAGPIRRGWIQVRSQTASVGGLLTYRHAQSGVEVSVEAVELENRFALFVEETDIIGSGLALFNPDPTSVIQFRIRDQDGNDPLGGGSVSWRDFHQAARTLPEWFAGQGVDTGFLKDFRGLLFLAAEDGSAFAPLGLRFGKRTSSLSAVPAIPNAEGGELKDTHTIVISPNPPRIFGLGEKVQFKAVVLDENGETIEDASVDWLTSAPAVATVSPEGVVATLALGSTMVTATSGRASESVRITVGPREIRQEQAALSAIYEQLNGRSWKDSTNWMTDMPLDTWSGVEIDPAGFVTKLRLDKNNLSGRLPPEIGAFTRLRNLDLNVNRNIVGEIPPEIGNLQSLESLKLSSTGLTGPVPPELGKLARLYALFLHFTQLTSIPAEIGDLTNLAVFDGFLSKFQGPLPSTIGNLKNLRELRLNGNHLFGAIPAEIGSMTQLERLHLHDNKFTGSIPAGLADAPKLSILRLSGNRLTGQLPAELGRARSLRWLAVDGNELSGPIPAEIGGARALTEVNLSSNRLSGSIPAELGKLAMVEWMSLADNPDLTGILPVELTGMQRLSVLMLGGTDVCAPADPEFLEWLHGLSARHVRRCVSTDGSIAYLIQAVQSPHYPVTLIAGNSALLRVFVVSEKGAAANASIPSARVTFYRGNSMVHAVELDGASARIPTVLDEGDLDLSLNSIIPGSVVQPGLKMVVEIDPEGTLDPALGIAERLPASGRTPIQVKAVPKYEITLIPFLWTEAPDNALLAKVNGLTEDSPLLWATRNFLPVHEIGVVHHDPIWLDDNPSADISKRIAHATYAARQAAGGRGHWVGVWSGCCGTASFQAQTAAVGLEPTADDRFWQNNNILAHELGHLMTLPHAPCNVNDPDPNFPQPDGSIGSWGYDMRTNELRPPTSPEVMSYCGEQEKWISGFYHGQALGWRLRNNASESPPQNQVRSLMLWGGVQPDGELVLEPAFVLDAVPTPVIRPGPYRITGRDRQGLDLFSYSISMEAMDNDTAAFAIMVPARPEWAGTLDRIELTGPERSAQVSRDGPTASALLTDPRTGRIRGFLRHGLDIGAPSGGAQAKAMLRTLVPEPGLVVQVSRGIPPAGSW